jgi:hypothetical protein
VANFSTAISKARNSVRQSDVLAVRTGLETCFDIMSASYGFHTNNPAIPQNYADYRDDVTVGNVATGVFKADPNGTIGDGNKCLQQDIIPKQASYPYQLRAYFDNNTGREYYLLCAKLENVGGVENLGNYSPASTTEIDADAQVMTAVVNATACVGKEDNCWFCVKNQQ